MTSRRQALALAGALTVTVFTAVAAVAGFGHRPATSSGTPAVAPQVVQSPAPVHTWRDD
ncbi:MAG: hypothetical protein ACM3QU_12335 [Verrucomicrobiota bacterium]